MFQCSALGSIQIADYAIQNMASRGIEATSSETTFLAHHSINMDQLLHLNQCQIVVLQKPLATHVHVSMTNATQGETTSSAFFCFQTLDSVQPVYKIENIALRDCDCRKTN